MSFWRPGSLRENMNMSAASVRFLFCASLCRMKNILLTVCVALIVYAGLCAAAMVTLRRVFSTLSSVSHLPDGRPGHVSWKDVVWQGGWSERVFILQMPQLLLEFGQGAALTLRSDRLRVSVSFLHPLTPVFGEGDGQYILALGAEDNPSEVAALTLRGAYAKLTHGQVQAYAREGSVRLLKIAGVGRSVSVPLRDVVLKLQSDCGNWWSSQASLCSGVLAIDQVLLPDSVPVVRNVRQLTLAASFQSADGKGTPPALIVHQLMGHLGPMSVTAGGRLIWDEADGGNGDFDVILRGVSSLPGSLADADWISAEEARVLEKFIQKKEVGQKREVILTLPVKDRGGVWRVGTLELSQFISALKMWSAASRHQVGKLLESQPIEKSGGKITFGE